MLKNNLKRYCVVYKEYSTSKICIPVYYKMDESPALAIMSVKESYLRATFTAIKPQYGSIDTYLEKVMGLQRKSVNFYGENSSNND